MQREDQLSTTVAWCEVVSAFLPASGQSGLNGMRKALTEEFLIGDPSKWTEKRTRTLLLSDGWGGTVTFWGLILYWCDSLGRYIYAWVRVAFCLNKSDIFNIIPFSHSHPHCWPCLMQTSQEWLEYSSKNELNKAVPAVPSSSHLGVQIGLESQFFSMCPRQIKKRHCIQRAVMERGKVEIPQGESHVYCLVMSVSSLKPQAILREPGGIMSTWCLLGSLLSTDACGLTLTN